MTFIRIVAVRQTNDNTKRVFVESVIVLVHRIFLGNFITCTVVVLLTNRSSIKYLNLGQYRRVRGGREVARRDEKRIWKGNANMVVTLTLKSKEASIGIRTCWVTHRHFYRFFLTEVGTCETKKNTPTTFRAQTSFINANFISHEIKLCQPNPADPIRLSRSTKK